MAGCTLSPGWRIVSPADSVLMTDGVIVDAQPHEHHSSRGDTGRAAIVVVCRSGGMADATVLNTVGLCPCGFESRLRHMGICRGFLLATA